MKIAIASWMWGKKTSPKWDDPELFGPFDKKVSKKEIIKTVRSKLDKDGLEYKILIFKVEGELDFFRARKGKKKKRSGGSAWP